MRSDLVEFNNLVRDMERIAAELAELGQEGFKVPFVITPDEVAEMVGAPMGPWRPLSNNLIWFYALKTTICAYQMLEQAGRIFEQMDDEESAQKVETIVQTVEAQFHPCETAVQAYSKLLSRPSANGRPGGSGH